jgi:hypothetical protein
MPVPCLATPKRGWNDRGYRAGLDPSTSIDDVRALAGQAEREGGEEFRQQVWVGFRAARKKMGDAKL